MYFVFLTICQVLRKTNQQESYAKCLKLPRDVRDIVYLRDFDWLYLRLIIPWHIDSYPVPLGLKPSNFQVKTRQLKQASNDIFGFTVTSSNSAVRFLFLRALLLGELVGGVVILSTVFFRGVCFSPPMNPRQLSASQWHTWATFLCKLTKRRK